MVTSQLLWGKHIQYIQHIQYVRDGEGALLDPVTLDSVYLDRGEVTDLSAVPPTETHKALAELGFTPDSPRADQREALHNRLHQLDLDPVPVRISGLRVVLTDACNMKCSYCFVETNTGKPDMTEQEIADGLTYLFETNAGRVQNLGGQTRLTCPAGTVVLLHHGIWHGGRRNDTARRRYMYRLRLNPTVPQVRLWVTRVSNRPALRSHA